MDLFIYSLFAAFLLLFSWGFVCVRRATRCRPSVGQFKQIERSGVLVSYYQSGNAEAQLGQVVLVPSLGRPASDFNELAVALNGAGYGALAVEPRGMKDSTGLNDSQVSLFDLADDLRSVIEAEITQPSTPLFLIGHAFGNRVARAYATRYGGVEGVILVAAGGKMAVASKAGKALTYCFWVFMPTWWRLRNICYAFFAGNEVPDHWIGGWNIRTSKVQIRATANLASDQWWHAGEAPLLVVQGMVDRIAPPEHTAQLLKEAFPGRVEVVEIARAGHAILPEQPEQVKIAVLDFLEKPIK